MAATLNVLRVEHLQAWVYKYLHQNMDSGTSKGLGPVYTEMFSLENANFCLRMHLSFT